MERNRLPWCCSADFIAGLNGLKISDFMKNVRGAMTYSSFGNAPFFNAPVNGGAVFIVATPGTYMVDAKGKDHNGKKLVDYLVKHEDAKLLATWKTIHGGYNCYLVGWFVDRAAEKDGD